MMKTEIGLGVLSIPDAFDSLGIIPGVIILIAISVCLLWIFVAGSAMLSVSISLNAMSTHGACTAIFVAVAAIGGFLVASIRTLGKVSSLAWIGMISILSASESIFTPDKL